MPGPRINAMRCRGRFWVLLAAAAMMGPAGACSGGSFGEAAGEQRSPLDRDTSPDVTPAEVDRLVQGNTAFALELFHQLRAEERNLFLSPLSISMAMAMVYGGARGPTETEMAAVLQYTLPQDQLHRAFNHLNLELESRGQVIPDEDDEGFLLTLANSVWAQDGHEFLPAYLELLALNYDAGVHIVDFAGRTEDARVAINDWVVDHTEGRITDMIPPGLLSNLSKLVLVNAIYFKAQWSHQFNENLTLIRSFHPLGGGSVDVPFMNQTEYFQYGEAAGVKVVELPYDGGLLSMVVVVPDAGQFDQQVNALDGASLTALLANLQRTYVELSMPLFGMECEFSLGTILQQMGMLTGFGSGADFSGMDGGQSLSITEVLHKSFVAVDENGTEAAAATAVVMGADGGMPPPPPTPVVLTVDRPFLFLIRDRPTGAVLFLGQVLNPQ